MRMPMGIGQHQSTAHLQNVRRYHAHPKIQFLDQIQLPPIHKDISVSLDVNESLTCCHGDLTTKIYPVDRGEVTSVEEEHAVVLVDEAQLRPTCTGKHVVYLGVVEILPCD